METLTIGKAAQRGGVKPETMRYYERVGLLKPSMRTEAGYRIYTDEDVERLRFIRKAQELGFALEEIRGLLGLRINNEAECSEVKAYAQHKIADIDEKMASLSRMRSVLADLVEMCEAECKPASPASDCPILAAMKTSEPDGTERRSE